MTLADQELRQSIVQAMMPRIPSQELPNDVEIDALMNQLSEEGRMLNLELDKDYQNQNGVN